MLDAEAILAILRADTPGTVAQALVHACQQPGTALCRVWLAGSPDEALLLTASAGVPAGGGTYHRVDGEFRRVLWGIGKIGRIADTAVPLVVRGIRGDEDWLQNPGWAARQFIRAFAGYPLTAGGRVYGVVARFDRTPAADEALRELEGMALCAAERFRELRERDSLQAQVFALEQALAPRPPNAGPTESVAADVFSDSAREIVTRAELRALEKRTIEAALARSRGRVFGPAGAAAILGMKPTTLASRLKALGIASRRRPPNS